MHTQYTLTTYRYTLGNSRGRFDGLLTSVWGSLVAAEFIQFAGFMGFLVFMALLWTCDPRVTFWRA